MATQPTVDLSQRLEIDDFTPVDYYAGGIAVVHVEGTCHVVSSQNLDDWLLSPGHDDPQVAIREFLQEHHVPALNQNPFKSVISGFAVTVPGGNAYGTGPIKDGAIAIFRKSQGGSGSAFGEVAAVDADIECNGEVECVALLGYGLYGNKHFGWTFGGDLGLVGKFGDASKAYPKAASYCPRRYIGLGMLPDMPMRLEVTDEQGTILYTDTNTISQYLTARDPNELIPKFLTRERAIGGVGVFMGAALNTHKTPGAEFPLKPGMTLTGYVADVVVVRNGIVARSAD